VGTKCSRDQAVTKACLLRQKTPPALAAEATGKHPRTVWRGLLFLLAVVLLPAGCSLRRTSAPPVSPYCRPGNPLAGVYHPDRLDVRKRCALVTGTVEEVRMEDYDGDVHIWLRTADQDDDDRLVVEIIPQDRALVGVPDEGARITAVGPLVDDLQHGWREIHPAWLVTPSRILPARPLELQRVRALLHDGKMAAFD
jgi:hypothetical protein